MIESKTEASYPEIRTNAVVAVLAAAGIVASLMQTLVVPLIGQLPTLLHTDPSNASWAVTVTLLVGSVATPATGRLGDLYGKKRMMLICLVPQALGSAVCAMAGSLLPMVLGRGLQGLGAGLIALALGALRDLLPPERLGSAIALISSSMGIGGALGLPLSAVVAQHASWHVLFWVAAGLTLVVMAAIAAVVPADPVRAPGTFDGVGALGLGAVLVCLLLAVTKGADWGWTGATTLSLAAAAVLLAAVWAWWELRIAYPLIDLRVTGRKLVLLTNVTGIVFGFGMYATSLIVPQLLELPRDTGYGLGQSLQSAGLWMVPMGLTMMVVSTWGARLSAARGPKVTLAAGALVMAVGYAVLLPLMGSTWGLTIGSVVVAAGTGLGYGAMPALIMSGVPQSETGAANSFNTLMRSLGTTLSAAVIAVVLAHMSKPFAGHALPSEAGFRTGLLISCVVAIVAAIVATAIPSGAPVESDAEHRDLQPEHA